MKKLKLEELGRMPVDEFKITKKNSVVVILEDIRSAINVGSVFRSADAFPVEKIILTGITAQPPHKDILKSALGATESVEWHYVEKTSEAIAQLKSKGFRVYAIEQTDSSFSLVNYVPESKIALVFGNEVDGVNSETLLMTDGCIEIPQYGTKHSLNISVCAGIVLYQIYHSRSKQEVKK